MPHWNEFVIVYRQYRKINHRHVHLQVRLYQHKLVIFQTGIIKLLWVIVIFFSIACFKTSEKYEYIEKNDAFRKTIKSGHFSSLSKGYTYYEFENLEDDDLIVLIHGFSVPSYIWDETYYESIKRGYGVLRLDLYGRDFSYRINDDKLAY